MCRHFAGKVCLLHFVFLLCSTSAISGDLVAYWSFDEDGGTAIGDASGYGNNGTLTGGSWVAGVSGAALEFDGIDNYVYVASSASLQLSDEMTIQAYIYLDEGTNYSVYHHREILCKGATHGGAYADYDLGLGSSVPYLGHIVSECENGNFFYTVGSTPVGEGNWHMVAVTFDHGVLSVFVDGQFQNSVTTDFTSLRTSTQPLYIGHRYTTNDVGAFDGKIDELKIYNFAKSREQIYCDYNDMTWSGFVVDNTLDSPYGVYAHDINDDGHVDILASIIEDAEVSWWENNGSMTFTKHVISNTFTHTTYSYPVDLDNDGDCDVLGASHLGTPDYVWWENNGSEVFTEHIIANDYNYPVDIMGYDIDGDGDCDVLTGTQTSTVEWWENDGNQNFTMHLIDGNLNEVNTVKVSDFDADGDVDILATAGAGDYLAWYENNGSQSFTKHSFGAGFDNPGSIYTADIDSDGDWDICSAAHYASELRWWENDGNQNLTSKVISSSNDNSYTQFPIDVDGDGDCDVVSGGTIVKWYENDGSQHFQRHNIDESFDAVNLYVADMDNDGDMDVVASEPNGTQIKWWQNNLDPLTNTLSYSVPTDQWVFIGIPVDVVDGSFAALFGDDICGSAGVQYRFSQWNDANNTYVRLGEADYPTDLGFDPPDFTPGQGFWLYHMCGSTITLDITAAQISNAVNGGAPCQIELNAGDGARTMVANPFTYISDWRRMRVYDAASLQRFSIFAAAQDNRINSYAYTYDGANEQWVQVNCYGTSNVLLDTWEGFFIVQTDAAHSYQLEMMPGNLMSGELLPGATFELDEPGAFTLPLVVRTADDYRKDTHSVIGIHSVADDQYDGLDAFEFTPRSPEFVQLYFDHSNWERLPDAYTYDYRSTDFSGGSKTWDFTVRTWQLPGEELELTWPDIDAVDDVYDLLLYPPDNIAIDLRSTDSYTFTSNNEADSYQNFRIVCRYAGSDVTETAAIPTAFGIHDLYPNPFNDQVRISYGLPKAGAIRLTVFNILGQQVAHLAESNHAAGLYHTQWHAKNMASGIYLIKLEAAGQNSVRKVQLIR